MRPLFILWFIC